jgi:colanic acid/amylovoran biosynthesis protein
MHAAILALCAGTPVVPISYEFKTKELFGSLGLPELVIDIEEVTASGLIEVVRAALDRLGGPMMPPWLGFASLRRPASTGRPLAQAHSGPGVPAPSKRHVTVTSSAR